MLFGIAAPSCGASGVLLDDVDGISCYKGNPNLPTYSHGSNGFSVTEVNSAVLISESEKTAVVDFYGFSVLFSRSWNKPIDPPEEYGFGTKRLIYRKDTKTSEVVLKGGYMYKMIAFEIKVGQELYEAACMAKEKMNNHI